MPQEWDLRIKVDRVLFILTGKKIDGYNSSAFFVCSDGNWHRLGDYDCFRFTNCQSWLRGDFENGGVQFFLKDDKENWLAENFGSFINTNPSNQIIKVL